MRWRKESVFLVLTIMCSMLLTTGCNKESKSKPMEDSIVMSYDEKEENNDSTIATNIKINDESQYFVSGGDDITGVEEEQYDFSSDVEQSSPSSPSTSLTDSTKSYYTAKDYLSNPSLFVPSWKKSWNPPAELIDFEKKWEAFFTPNGRLMSMAHRGGNDIHYPENSIEGILSCIAAGVDMIEIDIATTKDGVHVLMHDNTVTRTTNVKQLRASGAAGLPASDQISDWTFAQLRRLRLVHESAQGNVVTNYVIPTYEDVVMVCADKIFVYMDIKDRNQFDWERDAYPVIKKYRAYRSVLLPFDYSRWVSEQKLHELLSTIQRDSGYNQVAFQCSATTASDLNKAVRLINTYGLPKVLRSGAYGTFSGATSFDTAFKPYIGKYRIHVNTIFTRHENLASWKSIHAKGYNWIQVDDYMTLVKYIAEQM